MVAAQFQGVGGGNTVKIDQLVSVEGLEPGYYGDAGEGLMSAPCIQVPKENTAATYTKYYYISDVWDEELGDYLEGNGWADEDGNVLTDAAVVAVGKAFWFRSTGSAGGMNASGQVLDADSKTTDVKGGKIWMMIANPFPVAASLENVVTTGLTPGYYGEFGEGLADAPVIQVAKENADATYTKFYYISDVWDEEAGDYREGNGWADEDGNCLIGTQFPILRGAWFRMTGQTEGGTITFMK